MKLLTKANLRALPRLYANENTGPAQITVPVKFFDPSGSWTWYATEFDPDERRFFGFIVGHDEELGYFSLDELASYKGRFGLGIERDLHWNPNTTLDHVMRGEER